MIRQFYYDTNPIDGSFSQNMAGRLAAVQNAPTANGDTFIEMYSYTQPGEVTKKRLRLSRSVQSHTITGDLDAAYSYDNEGKMTSVTYPQSSYIDQNLQVQPSPVTTYTYGFDTMGRPTSMTGPGVDFMGSPATVSIVNGVQYGPASELLQMNYFGATETRQYNSRSQMTHLTVPGQLNISYNFASQNNGQISSQTDNLSGEQITYQYDALKRLYSATGSGWTQTFTYDGFGNLTDTIGTGGAPTNHSPVNAATNQLTGYTYDANGNLITTGFGSDPENRMSYANAGGVQYAYDGLSKRSWTGNYTCPSGFCGPGYGWQLQSETISFYEIDGKRLSSYTPQVKYVYGTPQSIYYLLGQERVYFENMYIGNANTQLMSGGTVVGQDRLGSVGKYFPYGEERNNPQWPNDAVKFATYTRDSATGLDYADQRYYQSGSGRFLSPDPYMASMPTNNPLAWNRYHYSDSDPINMYDPLGLVPCGSYSSVKPNGVISVTVLDCIGYTVGSYFHLPDIGSVNNIVQWDDVHPRRCPPLPALPTGIGSDQIQTMIDQTQSYYDTSLRLDPENAAGNLMGFLIGQFAPGRDWDYKHTYKPGTTDYSNATIFGNFAFGAVMESLGLSYYESQNVAGVIQIVICTFGGACGQGVPGIVFPYGDQPGDATDIERGYGYEKKKQAGCQ